MNQVLEMEKWDLTNVKKEVSIIQENEEFVIVDIETVGFKPVVGKDKQKKGIIEIAALKVKDGFIVDKFHSFVNPEQRISKKITDITGITDDDVALPQKQIRCYGHPMHSWEKQ